MCLRWLNWNKWRALCLSKNSNNIGISYLIALKLSHFTHNLSRNNTYVTTKMYYSLFLRDFAFIEHYFFYKVAILTKLSATIWFKLLESAYNNTLPWLFKFPQSERQNNNPRGTSKFGLLQCFPNLTEKRNNSR